MALSILGSLAALTAPRPATQAAPPAAAQPAGARAPAAAPTDRRNAPAVQVRLSPQALAFLGAAAGEKPQPAAAAAPRASAFQPLSFASALDRHSEAAAPPRGADTDAARPARPLRPGSRLDIKL